jgi:hypothetical protein
LKNGLRQQWAQENMPHHVESPMKITHASLMNASQSPEYTIPSSA